MVIFGWLSQNPPFYYYSPRTMLGGTIHDTEAAPPPTAHEVKDAARRASYDSST